MSGEELSLANSFQLELEQEGQVGRGAITHGEKPPIDKEILKNHADNYSNYKFQEINEDSFSVVHSESFEGEYGEFESWQMAYGVSQIDEDKYFIWLRYKPREEANSHDASKPWTNIIQKLGGEQ